jgi:hypothetical protein
VEGLNTLVPLPGGVRGGFLFKVPLPGGVRGGFKEEKTKEITEITEITK